MTGPIEPPRCGGCCGEGAEASFDYVPDSLQVFSLAVFVAAACGLAFALGIGLGYLLWGVA